MMHAARSFRNEPVRASRWTGAVLALSLAGIAFGAAAPPRQAPSQPMGRGASAADQSGSEMRRVAEAMRQNSVTLEKAIDAAKSQVKGTAIDARSRMDAGRPVVEVTVLDDSGRVSTVCVDATNGKVLRTEGEGSTGVRVAAPRSIVKASDIVGEDLTVGTGEDVGDVEDLAIDSTNGRIAYAIIELDGVSDSMFAVPWVALRPDGEMMRVDGVDRDRLRGAPSFTAKTWPADWSDAEFGRKIGSYYSRPAYRDGTDSARWTAMKASDMDGRNVKNLAGENVGEIEDLAIDPATGDIVYAVLSFGGFLGINDKLFAVPWDALSHQTDGTCRLAIEKDRLKDAPGFDKKSWPTTADPKFDAQMRDFYRGRTASSTP